MASSTLGERLRRLRQEAAYSQQNLADALGVTKTHISQVERDRSGISIELVEKWARVCGREPRDVYLMEDPQAQALLALSGLEGEYAVMLVKFSRILPVLDPSRLHSMGLWLESMASWLGIDTSEGEGDDAHRQ